MSVPPVTPDARPQAPHPWLSLLAGFAVVASMGMVTIGLISMWMAQRPVNLVPITDTLTALVTDAIHDEAIPLTAVRVSPPVLQQSAAAVWNHYDIEIELPPMHAKETVVRALHDKLSPRTVAVENTDAAPDEHALRLVYADAPFATVRVQGGRMERAQKRDFRPAATRIAQQVERIVHGRLPEAGQLAVSPVEARSDDTTEWNLTRLNAFVPDGLLMRDMQRTLEGAMAGRDVSITVEDDADAAEHRIRLAYQRYPVVELVLSANPPRVLPAIEMPSMAPPAELVRVFDPGEIVEPDFDPTRFPTTVEDLPGMPASGPARVAIIIDDGGEEPEATEVILQLSNALTVAILPDTSMGTTLAQRAAALGFEVMLHMPMQTENPAITYPNSLLIATPPEELARLIDRALEQVPGARGINNHTGGAYTANAEAVERLMGYLSTTGLYFVDSRTTPDTVALDTARRFGIRAVQRDVFLDNEPDFAYIERQFAELMEIATRRGTAVGIAHFRPQTAEALAALLPRLEAEGIRLVPVSELLQ